ncbi:hypothetical protein [Candidatus Symbiobacter mobilis]|uniref:Uncharacterized protein n=1 Tax=Candidatus Symbiobacter mobilis CR TaxID=946483 RepID=U5N838_9BURK|nr:hypothetical protein [Candidatus Symbiobacter mobilis]AGX87726.1 hypothetical protein Cenrod_1641 [Candidatus Symbiobacter mobilis CR]
MTHSLAAIQATLAHLMDHCGHRLPDEDVIHRRRGHIGGEDGDYGRGDTVHYLFGRDEPGEFLDCSQCGTDHQSERCGGTHPKNSGCSTIV